MSTKLKSYWTRIWREIRLFCDMRTYDVMMEMEERRKRTPYVDRQSVDSHLHGQW
ncbi:MAG: hypothetical protein AAF639_07365 [Chloroflexota bacterium]